METRPTECSAAVCPHACCVGNHSMRARRLRLRPLILASTLVLLMGFLSPALPAHAATFAVTTTTDAEQAPGAGAACTSTLPSGTCTLRAAIQAANGLTGGPHLIQLQV